MQEAGGVRAQRPTNCDLTSRFASEVFDLDRFRAATNVFAHSSHVCDGNKDQIRWKTKTRNSGPVRGPALLLAYIYIYYIIRLNRSSLAKITGKLHLFHLPYPCAASCII